MSRLDQIIEVFQSVDGEMRLELLLDFARRLPPLPPHLADDAAREAHRVPECQTPVFLWVQATDGKLEMHTQVAEEAPTVKGFLGILIEAFNGAPPEELAHAPRDLLERLGLDAVIRMTRTIGLTAVLARLRDRAAKLAHEPHGSPA